MARVATPSHRPDRPPAPGRGRGAQSNHTGRFETEVREAVDDGWGGDESHEWDGAPKRLATHVTIDATRRIITRNDSPDVPFDRSINPYRGCEHGCSYCFARPSHAYLGLSPGLDFETRLLAKPAAGALLDKELSNPNYVPGVIAIGTNTDPYQPIERTHRIMRGILKTLAKFNHPVSILTKNALIVRDLDLLVPLAQKGLVKAALSITTEDRRLARAMEPRASTPDKRFEALRALNAAGVPTAVMTAPMIPALNDHEMEALLERARAAGASAAGYTMLRLPREVGPLFEEWLEAHYPDRARRVLKLVRETHGGRYNDPQWGKRMRGEGPYAELLRLRFHTAITRLGLNVRRFPLRTDLFRRPAAAGAQLSLFDESEPC